MIKSAPLICLAYFTLFAGCAYISNYQEARALQRYSNSQERIGKYLQRQQEAFSKLKDDIVSGQLKPGLPKSKVVSLYGEPVFCKVAGDGDGQSCLYRHPTHYFGTDTAYLLFDEGRLVSWDFYPVSAH